VFSPPCKSLLGQRALLLRRIAGAMSGTGFLVIVLGCMNIQLGGRTVVQEDSLTFTQEGSLVASAGQEVDVFYPVPYASPPNLVVEDLMHNSTLVEQKADHFRLRNDGHFSLSCSWTARGLRGSIPQIDAQSVSTVVSTNTQSNR
jgi:hypothetical protein